MSIYIVDKVLRIIAGLKTPEEGEVSILGRDVTEVPPQKREVGFVFQHYAAFKHLTVRDNVGLRPQDQEAAEEGDRCAGERAARARPARRAQQTATPPSSRAASGSAWRSRGRSPSSRRCSSSTSPSGPSTRACARSCALGVGPVNRLGEAWIRPHDLELRLEPNGTTSEAMIERIVHLGFEVRVELVLDDGRYVAAQVTQSEAEELELVEGQIIYLRPSRTTVFSEAATLPGRP
jgi:ABC-type sulfate/molybdate transport systems ATPase subunit